MLSKNIIINALVMGLMYGLGYASANSAAQILLASMQLKIDAQKVASQIIMKAVDDHILADKNVADAMIKRLDSIHDMDLKKKECAKPLGKDLYKINRKNE